MYLDYNIGGYGTTDTTRKANVVHDEVNELRRFSWDFEYLYTPLSIKMSSNGGFLNFKCKYDSVYTL